ncbi:hypothetical protein Glove_624g26 [Diversispora epigaea]|uniref:BTB domain-containing protein n=1 Tax=Diversispora epigaea TaxID=1348612 RepID=A0A397G6Y5_9GLOM|nr:hypothetical protein Glove_624g26 [Diversispora epigaea]
MELKFFDKLSQNFIELLDNKDDYNVIIEVKNKEKSFTAHSNILKYRSSYFRKELENAQSNENNIKTIIKSSISAQIFDVILKYIYGGIINLESVETKFIFKLMLVADEFEFEELANKIENFLIETKAAWLRTHFSMVFDNIFDRKKFNDLQKFFNDIIAKHPSLIFERSDFNSLSECNLVSVLERDNLQMNEVKIWDYVIKWGIAQNPTLPTNLGEWSKKNFLTLKTTLQQCLPYIRYFHLSADEVLDSIKPYKKILGEQLWDDINQHLLSPERPVESIILPARTVLVTELPPRAEKPKELFSTIISKDHVSEISTWIDREKTTDIPYKFELILRGSRDGFAPQTFWDICHGHAGTILVTKVKGTDEILGGYNPLTWDNSYINSKWMRTSDSFIFSLKNGNVQNSILSRVEITLNAVLNICKGEQNNRGPHFGREFCLRSLNSNNFTLDNDCYIRAGYDYEKSIRTSSSDHFSIDDYEVFKIDR